MWSKCNVLFLECVFFGMWYKWNVSFLECDLLGMCHFWIVLFLECALFGISSFWNVFLIECDKKWNATKMDWDKVDPRWDICWIYNFLSFLIILWVKPSTFHVSNHLEKGFLCHSWELFYLFTFVAREHSHMTSDF